MWFTVLGPAQVTTDGTVVAVGGPRVRALLALLVLDAGRVVSTDRLIDGLYGEQPPEGAANALQAQVSRLRRALGSELVELRPGGYRLAVEPDDVDVHRFTRLAREGREALDAGDHAKATEVLESALGLWRGVALADVEAPFAVGQRVRLEELHLSATEDSAEARLALGEAAALVPELRQLVTANPLRERPAALLMRALNASGRQAEALTVFEDARRTLAHELGADPSPELADAHLAVLRAEPVRARPVPNPLTSFLGREAELLRVGELLARARLVTLTGPGGAGKTRLAVEAGVQHGGETCFVDFSPLRDGSEVPHAVLDALGLRESGLFGSPGQTDAVERAIAALTTHSLLLIVDNCEHVVDDAAAFLQRLLTACPGVRVLATSREALGVTGEALCPLPPLAPEPAAALFAERAAAVVPDAVLDEVVVRRICTALDGLPLAIELAAARLRTIPLAQLESRLDDRFRVLSRGSRTAAPRHQTLRAVVEWSWDLLDPAEQELLRRLSVFAGGATVESAVVCGVSEVDDLLAGLVEKSLLEAEDGRFRLLETIRAYGAERLAEAGERERFSRAHAEHFRSLARTADPHLRRAEQLTWLARLTAEHANLHAALRWAVDADVRLALELIGALSCYWWLRGVLSEVAPQAARLLDRLDTVPDGLAEEYALAVLIAGPSTVENHFQYVEEIMRALPGTPRQPYLLVAWALFSGPPDEPPPAAAVRIRDSDDPWVRALAHFSMSYLDLFGGRLAGAEREFRTALEFFRSAGDRWGTAQVLDGLATLTEFAGERERSLALTDEAIALVAELGAREELTELWCRRADRLRHSDPAVARADYERSAELARRVGVPATLALAHLGFAELARLRGDLAEARRWAEQALGECGAGWQSTGARSRVLTALGRIAEATGDLAGSRAWHRQAIELTLDRRFRHDLVVAVAGAAPLALAEGDPPRAARLLGIAEGLRGAPLAGDPEVDLLRARLAAEEVDRGRRMSYPEVRAYLRGSPSA
ncbi:BTAD domain-containing putative transcriptional regulator [Amycolatopsis sacchari]|uniref:Predicted ATPase n=1 Tax=Amycolatopsis sacchari TaxID=115433 RepID=A0A1I3LZA0_9PSEU|nr:BTAD domain-containing putative transcriptional regulator [Amycolatopsis sacchari]SFI90017.1 Predicted ATPase [Amycolatopsis sacchari]